MYQKIQRKLQNILCTVDLFEYKGNVLRVKGWIFSEDCEIDDISIVLTSKGKSWDLFAETKVERIDVYNFYKKNSYAKHSGFYTLVYIKGIVSGSIWLEYTKKGKKYRLYLESIHGKRADKVLIKPYAETVQYLNLDTFEKNSVTELEMKDYNDVTIDIVIPVYNGFQYLDALFASIKKTKIKYRLILIEDCSPDIRVREYLRKYKNNHPDTILIENEENLGFVKSVNKGLRQSCNHVALVNTDVEVPNMWLERLIRPILEDETIASTTPYTNAGTICSFPKIGDDNSLFLNLDLETIDNEFKNIKPRYVEMPTGVGFCMGMSRKALDAVGLLDEENFGKGYCEENDWCQRAIEKGMSNVQVENLFVYHKHGGSFLSEDKKRYIEKHSKILSEKYPNYNQEVAYFFEIDINKDIRKYVEWNLLLKMKYPTTVVFNHNLGGGATSYLDGKAQEILNKGEVFCVIQYNYDINRIEIIYRYSEESIKFRIHKLSELFVLLRRISPTKIIINELVSYPDLYEILKQIRNYKEEQSVELVLLVHDFYMICPTINLLDEKEKYCGLPNVEKCEQCLEESCEVKYPDYVSMKQWREQWALFMKSCDSVVAFSNNSKELVEKAFGTLDNIQVIPHKIDYLPIINKQYKNAKTINIGLLGTLVKHKGAEIVKETLKYIEQNNLNINIVLVGKCGEYIKSPHFIETGFYTRDMLPKLIFEYDIDIFWIASIWPETFSYTTEEIMTMKFPIMSFDMGAPAERIKKYEKGFIIPSMEPSDIVTVAQAWCEKEKKMYIDKKILFVVEEVTFSSRYRVEHLREQLLYQGITSDCILIKEALKTDLSKYESIVVYRSAMEKIVKKLVQKAHKYSKQVFYDIDDFIFEYDSISELDFLKYDEYKNFRRYCDSIKKTMQHCDAYITSTHALAKEISKSMNTDKVFVSRNVASAEMTILSLTEKNHVQKDSNKVILGYFSGTKTHDKDFEIIKDVLLEVLEKYDNVWLRLGGQIQFPKEFSPYFSRIETFDFVSWKNLPNLIASVDVNLMPLESTVFHECKSENKWQEAALVGVPTIASYNDELAYAIVDNENGLLCRNSTEWKEKLEKMIEDKQFRSEIAEAAHTKVMQEYVTYARDISAIKNVLCGEKG